MGRVLKRLQTPLPHETGFNVAENPYTESEFLKICEDYGVPHDPMRYRDEKFYWTYQCGVSWRDDYIGPDSMTRWIIEKSVDFTDVSLLRISESVRAYAYLILSSQASARSSIVGNIASSLTAQSAFLNNFLNNYKKDAPSSARKEGRMSSCKCATEARVRPKPKDSAATINNPINSHSGKICSCGKMCKNNRV